jgi:hypothetical protein
LLIGGGLSRSLGCTFGGRSLPIIALIATSDRWLRDAFLRWLRRGGPHHHVVCSPTQQAKEQNSAQSSSDQNRKIALLLGRHLRRSSRLSHGR